MKILVNQKSVPHKTKISPFSPGGKISDNFRGQSYLQLLKRLHLMFKIGNKHYTIATKPNKTTVIVYKTTHNSNHSLKTVQ